MAAREGRQQVRETRKERKKLEAQEKAKAALLKQGIQEQSTQVETKDAFSDTGGVPLSVKRRLTIGASGANIG